ncbi:hypothetical protein [Brachybacterium hainanense]|uniref:Uncharacterized protein n=1 Tax=Brachybacterium hainanense TaxID=1541174 RepID=A0ABV6RHK4_9MICO
MSTRRGRVVISSLTGEPIPWDEESQAPVPGPGAVDRPLIPDCAEADSRDVETSGSSDDARITRDVPPHWGNGR